ncbi:hypothetical protein [Fontibacillus panacisegetis]|uniref:hypothetical protein n=1 Tax=Fontibacillus solani TaxID=1572857 RepID=UPI0015FE43D9|nr:hypothetical protein [Fontibacillus solani]
MSGKSDVEKVGGVVNGRINIKSDVEKMGRVANRRMSVKGDVECRVEQQMGV